VIESVFTRADKLPLTLRFVEDRALVTASAAAEVQRGAELLAIDGRTIAEITAALLPLLHADGRHAGAQGKQLSQLDSGPNGGAMDRLFPLRFPTTANRRVLSLREPGARTPRRVAVPLAKEAERALPAPDRQWQFRIEGDTGVLTLPTFAFWDDSFKPQDFIDRSFKALRALPFLVIDQRRNEGGDDAIGRMLLAQLLREPYDTPSYRRETVYERVADDLKKYLGTWDERFLDRSGQVRPGDGRNWLMAESDAERVLPVAGPYGGRTVVLIGPENSSAGFFFARDLKATRAATLIGQPTGGNLRGLNAGQICWVTLPASGVAVDIPLVAHFAADGTPDAGIAPDVDAAPRFADAQAGIDTEMAAAHAQIARWRDPPAIRPA
jgi:Peptidase family S41